MSDGTATLEVRLNARLRGPHRGDRYEDPLAFWLESRFPGSRVVAAGTLVSPEGEPLSCAVRAEVAGDPTEVADAVVAYLEDIGTPRGSSVVVDGAEPRELGSVEGLALYLDGAGLPDEVYAAHDVNEFVDGLHAALGGAGAVHSYWESDTTTALYLYGSSADAMRAAVDPLLATHPLALGARLERIA